METDSYQTDACAEKLARYAGISVVRLCRPSGQPVEVWIENARIIRSTEIDLIECGEVMNLVLRRGDQLRIHPSHPRGLGVITKIVGAHRVRSFFIPQPKNT